MLSLKVMLRNLYDYLTAMPLSEVGRWLGVLFEVLSSMIPNLV